MSTEMSMQGYFEPLAAIYRIAGEKGGNLLHGQLSNHITGLKSGEGNYNLLLTQKGKVVADLYVYRIDNDYLLMIDKPCEQKVVDHLKKLSPLSRVEIADETSKYFVVHMIERPRDKSPLAPLFQRGGISISPFEKGGLRGILPAVFRTDRLGLPGYDILAPTVKKEELFAWLKQANLSEIPPEMREILRVEQGICKVGVDATEDNLPQEARLDRALHFDKGCYLGQETIARLHYLGHVNRILVGLKLDSDQPIKAGAVVFGGEKEVGMITSSVFSLRLNSVLALGYIPYNLNQTGRTFLVGSSGIKASIIELPLKITPPLSPS